MLIQVSDEELKRYKSWTLTEEDKSLPDIMFGKFLHQLEPKENYMVGRLKLISYRQKAGEAQEDFMNRYR